MPTHAKKYNICSLGLNSMQGREAKHVKLAQYVEHKRNAKKSLRWWTVFRHKFVHMMCLRERNPNSITYCIEERNSAILTFLGEFKIVTTGLLLWTFMQVISFIMVQYLGKVSLNFHQHNIKLDDTIISMYTCMIQKETWQLILIFNTAQVYIQKKILKNLYVKPSLSTYD